MKVFISACSKEFKACRMSLAHDFHTLKDTPIFQDELLQESKGAGVIKRLEKLVRGSECVIAIVGDLHGREPYENPRGLDRSFTQWEYYFTKGERLSGKRAAPIHLLIYFADDSFLFQQAAGSKDLQAELAEEKKNLNATRQQAFKEKILNEGASPFYFSTLDQLKHRVLVDTTPIRTEIAKQKFRKSLLLAINVAFSAFILIAIGMFFTKAPAQPDFSHLPGGDVLRLIYTSASPPGGPDSPTPELQCEMFEMQNAANAVSPLDNGSFLTSISDSYFMEIHCLSPGYLYVFTIGASGKVIWLSKPNSAFACSITNPVATSQTIVLPTQPNGAFYADHVTGTEHFYTVFCQSRWPELEHRLADAERSTPPPTTTNLPLFSLNNVGTEGTSPSTNASFKLYLNSKWFAATIASQPVRATNNHLVIEHWFQHITQ